MLRAIRYISYIYISTTPQPKQAKQHNARYNPKVAYYLLVLLLIGSVHYGCPITRLRWGLLFMMGAQSPGCVEAYRTVHASTISPNMHQCTGCQGIYGG